MRPGAPIQAPLTPQRTEPRPTPQTTRAGPPPAPSSPGRPSPGRPTEPRPSRTGEELRERAGVTYRELDIRTILNRCDTARMPDCWTINPYRGCSFGCRYCYARYTHEFLGASDPRAFEREIFVKLGATAALEREATERRLRARPIVIGTATDPYQPAEAHYGITASLLEVFARFTGLRISITTKSALVVRDLETLARIHARSTLSIHVSCITLDRALARELDPGAPTPERRLRTIATLARAGIPVGMNAMPILPAINDGEAELRALFRAARDAGAGWVQAVPLFLGSATRRHFLDWLRRHMPEKLPLYRRLYDRGMDVDPRWRAELRRRIEEIRGETGLPASRRGEPDRAPSHSVQLALPGLATAGPGS